MIEDWRVLIVKGRAFYETSAHAMYDMYMHVEYAWLISYSSGFSNRCSKKCINRTTT